VNSEQVPKARCGSRPVLTSGKAAEPGPNNLPDPGTRRDNGDGTLGKTGCSTRETRRDRGEPIPKGPGRDRITAGVGGVRSTGEASETRWREGTLVLGASAEAKVRETGASLPAPPSIESLQKKLYEKAKEKPDIRFYSLYDKIWRKDILAYAYEKAKANRGVSAAARNKATWRRLQGHPQNKQRRYKLVRRCLFRQFPYSGVAFPSPPKLALDSPGPTIVGHRASME
jgi:hypothetical protein